MEFEQDEEKAEPNPVLGLEVTAELLELQVSTWPTTFYDDWVETTPGLGNFFRLRAVLIVFWDLWATFSDKEHFKATILTRYKRRLCLKLLLGPDNESYRAGFVPQAVFCPPLDYTIKYLILF